jgi:hypothetical protein
MIQLPHNIQPNQATLDQLANWQGDITGDFETKSAKAKDLFPKKNKKANLTFKAVKEALNQMCSGARRCAYCEDSVGDEVEHVLPKDIYPDQVFVWDNYLYACGPCNGPKNNKFAVFRDDNGAFQLVNPPNWPKGVEPPAGSPALINPRTEDPLQYALLDIKSTFLFKPLPGINNQNQKRYSYTYDEVLRLNHEEREYLRDAREQAYGDYKARMVEYDVQKRQGATQARLDKMIAGIRKKNHPTVWREMQRWHNNGWLPKSDKDLYDLFLQNPEALLW